MNGPDTLVSVAHGAAGRHQIEVLNAIDFMPIRFLPVDPARFDVVLRGSLAPTLQIWSTTSASGFKTLPVRTLEVATLRLPVSGRMRWRGGRDEYAARPGQGFLLPFETLFEFEAGPDFEVLSCTIPHAVLAHCHRALEGARDLAELRFEPMVDLDTPPLRALSAALRTVLALMQTGQGDGMMLTLVSEIFAYQLLSTWPRLGNGSRAAEPISAAARAARTARDYVDAHLSEPLLLADIAAAAETSVRALQNGFRREFGQTPVQYIIGARLDRVYVDLLEDRQATVAEIARRWGFTHLGDFSRRYALRFGTTPARSRR